MSGTDSTTPFEYRDVPGFPGYRIGDDGSVQSCRIGGRWKPLKPKFTRGHAYVGLWRDGKQINRYVHRLVLEAFVGPCPDGLEGCHFDDDPWNNRLSNLRWDTRSGNKSDEIRNGRRALGSASLNAKLTEAGVRKIREDYATGCVTQQVLATRHGISIQQVSRILNRKQWAHLE